MKIIRITSPNDLANETDVIACIGAFDGIHLGHQKLIDSLACSNLKKAMITFDPNPKEFFSKSKFYYLTPLNEKIKLLENKLDFLFIIKFDLKFANLSKNDFLFFLKKNHVKKIVCGYDFTFGKNKEGSIQDLDKDYTIVEKVLINDQKVSSSLIRGLLSSGNVSEINTYLGRNYTIEGLVITGNKLGRTIGFPTANILQGNYYLPKNGVYLTKTLINNAWYYSMTNIGNNPTFNYCDEKRIETHIIDFNGDLYNKTIRVEFIDRIRDEVKFSSKDELVQELTRNKKLVVDYKNKK